MTMTPDLLRQVGTALFGEQAWQAALADALAVQRESMRDWARGRRAIPPHLAHDLAQLVADRIALLESVARLIRPAPPAP